MPVIMPTGAPIPGASRVVRPRGAGGFVVPQGSPQTARGAALEGTASLSALIDLQSGDPQSGAEPVEDREARRHGRDLLAHLAALHRALLGDPEQGVPLAALSDLVASLPATARDKRLADAVEAIRLRARIELARYVTPG